MAPAGGSSSGGGTMGKWVSVLNPLTWRERLGLDARSFLFMLKGALPPTIVIAISQSSAIADITTTIGYLAALISILSQALMPRAKFMKIVFFDIFSACVSSSLCCLALFCAIKAREHNTPADASYSSEACAVSAIWLIFMMWISNTIRAWRPQELQDPMVAFSIFALVTLTRGGMFTSLSEALSFVARLLKGFMIGFSIAIGVSLFILPITCRGHVFQDVKGYVAQIDAVLQAQIGFVKGTSEAWTGGQGLLKRSRTARSMREMENHTEGSDLESKQKQLTAAITKLNALHGKLQSDLMYSKDEIAWGKLSADDLIKIGNLLRSLLLPLSGMAMLPDVLDMIIKHETTRSNSVGSLDDDEELPLKQSEIKKVTETLEDRLVESSRLVTAGLQYVLLTLELVKRKTMEKQRSARGDEEASGEMLSPLQDDFASRFAREMRHYLSRRKDLTRTLASLEAFSVAEKLNDASSENDTRTVASDPDVKQEFFLILYMGHLQESLLKATLDMIQFADGKVEDGTMKGNRLICPPLNTIMRWFALTEKDDRAEPDSKQSSSSYAESNVRKLPDPEHLPPANWFEKSSLALHYLSHFIRSEQSVFGFRVSAAAFCVGILAYLRQTQEFFVHQRCIWAMIVIVIGMNPTSGQTMFGFIARIVATAFSVVLSLIVWYIVDEKTPGVIVFLYLANVLEYYFYVNFPQYFGASVVAIVTLNVIVGYELQVRKLGLELATSNGQPYYPIYLFGPYKLAAVAAGCAISFFWVIFPYPITAKSTLRKALGRGLFVLAKFYSCMHSTIELWLTSELGNEADVRAASQELERARHKVFREEMILLNSLRMHSHFSTFEPPIGGKFPKETYDRIIAQIQRVLMSMALMAQTTQTLDALAVKTPTPSNTNSDGTASPDPTADPDTDANTNTNTNPFNPDPDDKQNDRWISNLASIALHSSDFKSHKISSLLCHLSASMMNAQPLPPYLAPVDSFPLAREMQRIDGELLNIRHVEDPAFSAFVCLEVLRSVVSFGVGDLLGNVKSLVGELSFDFRVRHVLDREEVERLIGDGDEDHHTRDEE
ncbi:MFS transporter [Aspergillus heteromorphus CBS 117.55]|uniref:MFS transporter n=1 Tax=Aspergillus heteromorphus CBS 117.55 TaxID=1448321 RepID=A0A317VM62_9EURO|nr:MFS transporter [Aspergillus heteromorphus CBS 117.55]PWY75463.1 MFS transporter [Aspergillus heteromorphus CBS 117.55]